MGEKPYQDGDSLKTDGQNMLKIVLFMVGFCSVCSFLYTDFCDQMALRILVMPFLINRGR